MYQTSDQEYADSLLGIKSSGAAVPSDPQQAAAFMKFFDGVQSKANAASNAPATINGMRQPTVRIPSQGPGARAISFLLDDVSTGKYEAITLHIRPEDLSVSSPSRLTPHQTFGAPWVDSFGPGLRTIQISGTTGWRGNNSEDALTAFQKLHDLVYKGWHDGRARAVDKGLSPDGVKLVFCDDLDHLVSTVVPVSFTLRRNKTRPLLVQYQISLVEILDGVSDDLFANTQNPANPWTPLNDYGTGIQSSEHSIDYWDKLAAKQSAQNSLDSINKTIADIGKWVDGTLGAPVSNFTKLTADICQKALDGGLLGILGYGSASPGKMLDTGLKPLMNIATNMGRAASNVYKTVYAIMDGPAKDMAKIAKLYKEFNNVACILGKIKGLTKTQWLDTKKLFGASTCSSTSGGLPESPLKFDNPFEKQSSASSPQVDQTSAASEGTKSLMDMNITEDALALWNKASGWINDATSGTNTNFVPSTSNTQSDPTAGLSKIQLRGWGDDPYFTKNKQVAT